MFMWSLGPLGEFVSAQEDHIAADASRRQAWYQRANAVPQPGGAADTASLPMAQRPYVFKIFPMGHEYGPLPSLKGSEVWIPVLKVVHNDVIMGLQGFRIRAHTRGP